MNTRHRNPLITQALTALPLAAALLLVSAPLSLAEEVTKTFPVNGHSKVRVLTDDGAVRVSTGDIKQIEIRVVYSGYKLDRDLRVSTTQNGDQVEVVAKTSSGSIFNWGVRHANLRVEVHMPKDTDLEVTSGDGSVEADALNGNVDIKTGDGSITVVGGKGTVHMKSGDGHIDGKDLDGNVDASAGDGSINIEGRFDVLNVHTGDGSITVRARPGSRVASSWNFHAGDGSIDVDLPGDLQANIDASTHDGHISLGIPVTVEGTFSSSRITGRMNGGGQTIVVRTGDGSIHLSKT
ncbi:MAG: DUF4097 family beta strand repeat-containing protein [Candidatus Acidiferrum sp.]